MKPILEYRSVRLTIHNRQILNAASLSIYPGKITGLIGKSGAGKSMLAYSAMGLLPKHASLSGQIILGKQGLIGLREKQFCMLRGNAISMVFQEPMTALNPLQTIEYQIHEAIKQHGGANTRDVTEAVRSLLERVGLPPSRISPKRLPHELSGGQRQRVVIAMAIANQPSVILVDEPTTALDATTQAAILDLLYSLCKENDIGLLLVTHDLGVISEYADTIAVLKDGSIVDSFDTDSILRNDLPASFQAFLPDRGAPARSSAVDRQELDPVLSVQDVSCAYASKKRALFSRAKKHVAVKNVSLSVYKGESVGIVGESGSGKSTLARAILGLQSIENGNIQILGKEVAYNSQNSMIKVWRDLQIVFQDPYSSFNPRHSIYDIVSEPLYLLPDKLSSTLRQKRVSDALLAVGLEPGHAERLPSAFSGGQRQRIAIARALIVDPAIIVLDEATSALDTQSRDLILDLLRSLQESRGLSFVFIAHDLSVVRELCHRVAVMKDGVFVETGATESIFDAPQHAYTQGLVSAAQKLDVALNRIIDHHHTTSPSRSNL